MIAAAGGTHRAVPRLAAAAQGAGERVALGDVGEVQLDRDPPRFRAHRNLVSERGLECVAEVFKRRRGVGVDRSSPWLGLWLASQPNPVLGFAHRPSPAHRIAAEAAADVVALGTEQGLPVTLAERA